ncbi:mitochondrial carrier [Clavulina sp. PMI_390]|nr:mitochondrial carrier [Clavulina sp. PMI_390]
MNDRQPSPGSSSSSPSPSSSSLFSSLKSPLSSSYSTSSSSSSSSLSAASSSHSSTIHVPDPCTREELFQTTLGGTRSAPLIPRLSSDPDPLLQPTTNSLPAYIAAEGGPARRLARLKAIWQKLPRGDPRALSNDGNNEGGVRASPTPMELNLVSEDVVGEPEGGGAARGGKHAAGVEGYGLTPERASLLRTLYLEELASRCGGVENGKGVDVKGKSKAVDWDGFVRYADDKEKELWNIFHKELDLDGNGHLDADEWATALAKSGIHLSPNTLQEFIVFLTSSPHSKTVSYPEFRDFLLLMPRAASTAEIYRYYEVRRFDTDSRGASRITMEGDVSLSGEDIPSSRRASPPRSLEAPSPSPSLTIPGDSSPSYSSTNDSATAQLPVDHHPAYSESTDHDHEHEHGEEEEEDEQHAFVGSTAIRFFLAGGVAGVVSRTATAPFDRLKVYFITAAPEQLLGAPPPAAAKAAGDAVAHAVKNGGASAAAGVVGRAIVSLYRGGGIKAFWVGNGLNSAKILPESAIKFMSYETSKRFFAKYYDHVDDPRDISGVSRFISGGIGGITSQLAIYPVETVKTQLMSTKGSGHVLVSMRNLYANGGIPAFYRGLVIGLVGVFPYSAIDMSTFEALKIAYSKSTGKEEPSVLAMLAFGSVSGSVGATSVYPLNLVRTRLQASGSSGHPQKYDGMMDVVRITYAREGWKGFYKGLMPTLAKVVPAVSISYVVYEKSKKGLGVT